MNKTRVEELALFGGQPLFEKTLHVGKPNIGSREKLFAGDWRALLPEGLGLLVLASCMTNGIYLPEDFKLIDDRGGANLEDARISTFETEVGDRALHYRGYRGPSFSPGIGAEAWFTLRRFLPARISPGVRSPTTQTSWGA